MSDDNWLQETLDRAEKEFRELPPSARPIWCPPPGTKTCCGADVLDECYCYVESLLDELYEVPGSRLNELRDKSRELTLLKLRVASLIGAWRKAADEFSRRGGNAQWASHFYDCANELERIMTTDADDREGRH